MSNMTRRVFTQLATAAALTNSKWVSASVAGSEPGVKGKVTADPSGNAVPFNRMIFGQFLEHFHRQVYGGVFDPGSALSNDKGFRLDVIEALRELRVPIVRWPGGCFVSAYHWRDGVGKTARRVSTRRGVSKIRTASGLMSSSNGAVSSAQSPTSAPMLALARKKR